MPANCLFSVLEHGQGASDFDNLSSANIRIARFYVDFPTNSYAFPDIIAKEYS